MLIHRWKGLLVPSQENLSHITNKVVVTLYHIDYFNLAIPISPSWYNSLGEDVLLNFVSQMCTRGEQ